MKPAFLSGYNNFDLLRSATVRGGPVDFLCKWVCKKLVRLRALEKCDSIQNFLKVITMKRSISQMTNYPTPFMQRKIRRKSKILIYGISNDEQTEIKAVPFPFHDEMNKQAVCSAYES